MKNLIISILSAVIITGMDFWEYSNVSDRPLIAAVLTIAIFVGIVSWENWRKDCRMKRFRAERFGRMVNETKNRP